MHTNYKQLQADLEAQNYICEPSTAMALSLSINLQKPLLVEGPAGVGKTEIAKILSKILNTNMIRLQCYEGLDASHAIYEWNYQAQLLYLKSLELKGGQEKFDETSLFSDKFLLKRPLFQAIMQEQPPVLLIDEIDRADEEFESYLLEILSDWQISIPEIGTIHAKSKPLVVLTGNRSRDLSEALRRRCIYLWLDMPNFDKELAIIHKKVPNINEKLAVQITHFMQELRQKKLNKQPGIAETLDWAAALASMHFDFLDANVIEQTLGVILKDWEDMRTAQLSLSELLDKVGVQSKL
jgi:MoxR-like ATPase